MLIGYLRQLLDPMSHFPSIWSDLIRDLIRFGGNGSLDLKVVLSDLLAFRMVYSPKYFCDFTQLFQNNMSVFSESNQSHPLCISSWIVAGAQVGYFRKNRHIILKQLCKITEIFRMVYLPKYFHDFI